MDVVILCGGFGTRLRPLSGQRQKVLVPVGGKPFIGRLMDSLLNDGFKRFVLCSGYQKEQIRSFFEHQRYDVFFSEENEPLGTGGAIKHAMSHIESSSFLVLNGDSICPTNYHDLAAYHHAKGGVMTVVLTKPLAEKDYGVIQIDQSGRIVAFREKSEALECGYINAGIYVMNRDIFGIMPAAEKFSLEYDLMPKVIAAGCYGFVTNGVLVDIGTPERCSYAQNLFPKP
jgi:NDP-sugar pyrophosphorylase family protein